ncbi:MAG: WD40 repeat domain-containing protein, partial [bacterium]|nr:WD40 repeat domain-containing protein [bacterium]
MKWKVSVQGAAGVNISGDGKVAVAALCDGTIRWYRMSDGKNLMTLFPHKDGRRWVLWTPSGYYAASGGADDLIGWHINRGRDKTPDFFAASRFRHVYYRPDVTERVIAALDEKKALRLANEATGKRRREEDLKKLLPPVLTILSPEDGQRVRKRKVDIRYRLRNPSGEPVTELMVLVDGRSSGNQKGIRRKKNTKTGTVSVTIPERDCEVSLIAKNRYTASEPGTIRLKWLGKAAEAFIIKPKLYVLAVGVSDYEKNSLRLQFPAKDARDIAAAFMKQKNGIYRDVETLVLTDDNAEKGDVLDGLEWIKRETTAKDLTVVFLSGHGVNDRNGAYYYLP